MYDVTREAGKDELTPLVADQHWTCCMPGAVVSLPAGKQVVPEHCSALKYTQTADNSGWRSGLAVQAKTHILLYPVLQVIKPDCSMWNKIRIKLPFGAKLLHQHLGILWLHRLLHHSSRTQTGGGKESLC